MSVQTSTADMFNAEEQKLWPHKPAKSSREVRNHKLFARLDADLFLANQLFRHGLSARVLEGITAPAERRERLRREILAADLDATLVRGAERGSAPETLAQAFERLYRQPLID